ncbi:MAG: hypothetical protein V2A53_04845 [bacterium]
MKKLLLLIGALMLWAGLGWAELPPWPQYQHNGQHTGRSQYPEPDIPKQIRFAKIVFVYGSEVHGSRLENKRINREP